MHVPSISNIYAAPEVCDEARRLTRTSSESLELSHGSHKAYGSVSYTSIPYRELPDEPHNEYNQVQLEEQKEAQETRTESGILGASDDEEHHQTSYGSDHDSITGRTDGHTNQRYQTTTSQHTNNLETSLSAMRSISMTNIRPSVSMSHPSPWYYSLIQPFIIMYTGWKVYMSQDIVLAGLSLGFLYLTVLGFDSVTVGFAKEQGVSESLIGNY